MSGLFSKPKIPSPPPLPPLPPEPPTIVEDTGPSDEDYAQKRRKLSRPRSILAGDLTPETGKKRLLG